MSRSKGSKYVIGDMGLTEVAEALVIHGRVLPLVLNPHEPDARAEIGKGLKSVFSRRQWGCRIESTPALIEQEKGVWLSTHIVRTYLTEKLSNPERSCNAPTAPEQPAAYFLEPEQLEVLRHVGKALYGDGRQLTADARRDLANQLNLLIGQVSSQALEE